MSEQKVLLFQYGSNCLESRINCPKRLRGDARFFDIGRVDGFRLAFDVWSYGNNCAAANIISHLGGVVWGVIYEVPAYLLDKKSAHKKDRKSMQEIEGEKYDRKSITAIRPDGQQVQTFTYIANRGKNGIQTSSEYVDFIVRGLREHGVGAGYINSVKKIAYLNNPEIEVTVADI